MGWGFRKSIKVAPGIRINLSKSGVSTSIGWKGFTYNTRGRVTASIPGTGIRFTQNLKGARTSRPVSSVVTGSRNLDADGSAQLSKREQATQDLVQKVQGRTAGALVNYFFSHGVYVRAEDLSEAVTLEDHQEFLQSLSREFETTTNAIRLAVNIGSISLAEKEKAMRAVYEIEKQCSEHQGQRAELSQAASALLSAVRSFPSMPSLVSPLVIGLVGAFITYAVSAEAGLGLTALALLYGYINASKYLRQRNATLANVEAADHHFDSLFTAEVTPRPSLHIGRDIVRPKAIGFAAVTLVATVCAVVMHFSHPIRAVADTVASDGSRSADTATAPSPAPVAEEKTAGLSWMIGKYPYDLVNDRRFRAAFQGVSRADWKKIGDRLTVVNQAGVESKDGFLVGEGCKAHQCNSEKVAFAINESTGKGVLIMMETPGSSPVFTTYRWKQLTIGQTPLAAWEQQQLADSIIPGAPSSAAMATSHAAPSFAASFDCSKAHSDAEHLICGDAELAAADVELAGIYVKAKAAATDQPAFRERTRAQWMYREKTCHDRECVARWYADQKIALNEIATTGAVGP
ncbi:MULTISPECIES: DUF4236 domain-containing protein [unclassified Caballeronia]|uniref:DUF4236 domain-containing protein n=1 Tax=unclassified Caballeronia TaxID=2646786 RepID=UPI00158B7460|nr:MULTISPECIES: DUF4236 domain-containing protein [unclassified Caballeronia]QSN63502.1 DUF4236 domain-containing protein [Caballeronia sp. M1242]